MKVHFVKVTDGDLGFKTIKVIVAISQHCKNSSLVMVYKKNYPQVTDVFKQTLWGKSSAAVNGLYVEPNHLAIHFLTTVQKF